MINGHSNIRDKENGDIILTLEDNTTFNYFNKSSEKWGKISFSGFVKNEDITSNTIKENAVIYNYQLKKIGQIKKNILFSDGYCREDVTDYKCFNVTGFTHINNIKPITIDSIKLQKEMIFDKSNTSKIVIYKDDSGFENQIIINTFYEIHSINSNKVIIEKILKENYRLGDETSTKSLIANFYNIQSSKPFKTIESEFDDLFLNGDVIILKEYLGCCSIENNYKIINLFSEETIIEYYENYHKINFYKNNGIKLFIGYLPELHDNNKLIRGYIYIGTNQQMVSKIVLKAKDENSMFDYDELKIMIDKKEYLSISENQNNIEVIDKQNINLSSINDLNIDYLKIKIENYKNKTKIIDIPIIYGKVLGSSDKNIELIIDLDK
jgi:hypothetical protein